MNRLSNYKSKTPEFNRLPEGWNTVRLAKVVETDSFHNYNGTLKENLPQYSDPCEQLAATFVSTANPSKGAMTHRFNLIGYTRFNELSDAMIKSGKFTDVGGYACAVNKRTDKLERIEDKARSAKCIGIVDQLFAALGLPEGSGIDALDDAISERLELDVNVVNEPYDNGEGTTDQFRISQFRKKKASVPVMADVDDIEA